MAARVRMVDGRELTVLLSGKRETEAPHAARDVGGPLVYARLPTILQGQLWINPNLVAAIEDRPEFE